MAGRVLAHEIGHFLLRIPRHSAFGLMQAHHSANDFASPDKVRFVLAPIDVRRLADKKRAGSVAGPAAVIAGRD